MEGFVSGWPTILAAFLGAFVEAVEAFTIVLAVGMFQGWRPAFIGSIAGLLTLAAIALLLGPLIAMFPIHVLQLLIGVLLLLFGLRWLRKAILRAAGIIALHDEEAAYTHETATLRQEASRNRTQLNWIAGMTVFKAILLEGIEVIFIVIAIGAAQGSLWPASVGALAACAIVLLIGLMVHKPLSRIPENTIKFGVGIMLSAFGVFWTGEGLGVHWPGEDLAILLFMAVFVSVGVVLVNVARRSFEERAQ